MFFIGVRSQGQTGFWSELLCRHCTPKKAQLCLERSTKAASCQAGGTEGVGLGGCQLQMRVIKRVMGKH